MVVAVVAEDLFQTAVRGTKVFEVFEVFVEAVVYEDTNFTRTSANVQVVVVFDSHLTYRRWRFHKPNRFNGNCLHMNTKWISLVEAVIERGGRIRQHTVYDHLPKQVVRRTRELAADEDISLAGALYLVLNKIKRPYCQCGKPVPMPMWPRRLRTSCSSICAGADPETDRKRRVTNLQRYGVEYVKQDPTVAAKQRKTMLNRYGVTCTAASPDLRKKMQATLRQKYGVDSPFKSSEIQARIRSTVRQRYGVDHVMQCRELHEKSQLARSKVREIRLQGKTFRLRGYEPQVVEHLVSKVGVSAKRVLTTAAEGVPAVQYVYKGSKHYYHPDLMIKTKKGGVLIEVKSTYTLGIKKGQPRTTFARVKAKIRACLDQGWDIRLAVVDRKGTVVLVRDLHTKTRRQVRLEFEAALRAKRLSV